MVSLVGSFISLGWTVRKASADFDCW